MREKSEVPVGQTVTQRGKTRRTATKISLKKLIPPTLLQMVQSICQDSSFQPPPHLTSSFISPGETGVLKTKREKVTVAIYRNPVAPDKPVSLIYVTVGGG